MKMNQSNFRAFNKAFKDAVKELEETFGVEIKQSGGSYDENHFTATLTVTNTSTASGKSVEQETFEQNASMYGFNKEDYNMTFDIRGEKFNLYGLNPRAPKNACKIRRVSDGKEFKCPLRTLGRKEVY